MTFDANPSLPQKPYINAENLVCSVDAVFEERPPGLFGGGGGGEEEEEEEEE